MNHRRITRFVFTTVSVLAALAILFALVVASSQIDIPGPAGSGSFGSSVTVLPNGNLVICDPGYDAGSTVDVGAAYLYDGADGTLISKLTGSTANDRICTYGVTVLANENYLVRSPYWDNGAAADAGAVTWGDGETGISGTVSAANSLVGNSPGDQIGFYVDLLANGNYVVHSSIWDNGSVADAGAVTWGNGATGITGPVSAANSLVGSSPYDQIGNYVDLLANGNYLVISPLWDNGPAADAGVVTWGNGITGISGPVSPANSLVGSSPDDQVGYLGVTALSNGNYVVNSPYWDNGEAVDAGAVTWGDGATGITGLVSAANSLAGSTASDQVGASYYQECTKTECHEVIVNNVSVLSNGNYVVNSPYWDNRAAADVGAVTWGNGTTGVAGTVSAANSLVGSTAYDQVGSIILPREGTVNSVDVLANGNYVVKSLLWDNGEAIDAGAVTWGDGANGTYGQITAENSVLGEVIGGVGGSSMFYKYDYSIDQLVVSRPAENTVTLFRPNRAPVAQAGWPHIAARGALVRLDGSASHDPDGNLPLQFTWTQTGGPLVSLSDPHAISPTFTAPDERTVLTFNLVVTDALGLYSQPSTAIVFVDPYQYYLPWVP